MLDWILALVVPALVGTLVGLVWGARNRTGNLALGVPFFMGSTAILILRLLKVPALTALDFEKAYACSAIYAFFGNGGALAYSWLSRVWPFGGQGQ